MMSIVLQLLVIVFYFCQPVHGNGRLIDPPSRSSMWRFGFANPPDYDDMSGRCSLFEQLQKNRPRCRQCGDVVTDVVKEHEAGGKFANGIIVKTYKAGSIINATVQLTAPHLGHFEFLLCVHNSPKVVAHETCFRHLKINSPLALHNGDWFPIGANVAHAPDTVTVPVKLPVGVTCSQCIFQWKYHVGNSWGVDKKTKLACLGCGVQDEFYACADISITP